MSKLTLKIKYYSLEHKTNLIEYNYNYQRDPKFPQNNRENLLKDKIMLEPLAHELPTGTK